MEEKKSLDISWITVFRIFFAVITFYLLFAIRDILVWIVFALVISILFNPLIEFLTRRKIPRFLSVIFVYLGSFGLLGLLVYLISPFFVSETRKFLEVLPVYFERISPSLSLVGLESFETAESVISALQNYVEKVANNIFGVIFLIFGGFFSGLFIIATAFFLSLEKGVVEKSLTILFPKKYEEQILAIWKRCQKKVSGWFLARIMASIFVGTLSYLVLLVFNVDYPFSLGLLAGIFNFVPYIGPAITAVFLFLIISPFNILKALFVFIAFVLIQQVEGNIITPILMKRIMGLPPSLVLIALVIGGKLWGVLGAILIIPLMGILFEFLREFLAKKREREAAAYE